MQKYLINSYHVFWLLYSQYTALVATVILTEHLRNKWSGISLTHTTEMHAKFLIWKIALGMRRWPEVRNFTWQRIRFLLRKPESGRSRTQPDAAGVQVQKFQNPVHAHLWRDPSLTSGPMFPIFFCASPNCVVFRKFKPTISEQYSKRKYNGITGNQTANKDWVVLCHIGLMKNHGSHLVTVNQPCLSLFEVLKNNIWRSSKHS